MTAPEGLERLLENVDRKTAKIDRLVQVLGSIARGRDGRAITGKDAQMRARAALEELGMDWRSKPIPNGER